MKRVLLGLTVLVSATTLCAQVQDGAFFRDAWNVKAYPAAPRLAMNAAMVPAVALPAADKSVPEEIDAIMQWNAAGREPMHNGFKRALPDTIDLHLGGAVAMKADGPVAFARGLMSASDRGTTVWSTVVQVEKADRLRLHLENVKLPAGAVLWVYGAGETPRGFGSELIDPAGSIWAPSVQGPLAYLDVEVPAGTQASFTIREIMELIRTPAPNDVPTCLIDASCVTTSQFAKITPAELAVAHLEFIVGSQNAVCTGGLLNDRAQDGTPFLLTANHCFSDQTIAASLEAFFDYRTNACNGTPPNPSTIPHVVGATLLASSANSDFTFIQLSSRPPGRALLGWDANSATVASSGVHLNRVSHPVPDGTIRPQQYSSTTVNIGIAQCRFNGGTAARPRFIYSTADHGGIYGGSSGSPEMTDDGHVVGQLLGSCPSGGADPNDGCDSRNATVDGAFSETYNSVANWLENGSVVTPTVCTPGATTLCLSNNRFAVSATWKSKDASGQGQAVPLTSDTGYFWFFSSANVEMVVKVLNACVPAFGNKFWVFAGGLTDVQVNMTVIDTQTGTVKTYTNPQSTAFQPIQDTGAFATCP